MSLSALMGALVEYVGDALVNDCGVEAPDRILLYHSGNVPADCCTDAGTLVVSWSTGFASQDFPAAISGARADPCAARPVYTITIHYRRCWPVPNVDSEGVEVSPVQDAVYNAAAALFADVSECVTRALLRLNCRSGNVVVDAEVVDLQRAILDQVSGAGWLRFVDTSPTVPSGGCAGVLWRLHAAPRPGPVS